jgi:hypothetical protein
MIIIVHRLRCKRDAPIGERGDKLKFLGIQDESL